MILETHGNLVTEFLAGEVDVLIHSVNCQGKMNKGLGKQIRNAIPVVYQEYVSLYTTLANKKRLLGTAQFVHLETFSDPETYRPKDVVNLFAQYYYGEGTMQTNHDAFEKACQVVANYYPVGTRLGIPFKIGCGLGGGNWDIVRAILERVFREHVVYIYIYTP